MPKSYILGDVLTEPVRMHGYWTTDNGERHTITAELGPVTSPFEPVPAVVQCDTCARYRTVTLPSKAENAGTVMAHNAIRKVIAQVMRTLHK